MINLLPNTGFLIAAAFLVVFGEAAFNGVRWLTGTQLDLLPSLMVYTAVAGNVTQVAVVAFCGGIWLDSLSANPLGISVIPLILIGLGISLSRELVVRDQAFAQMVMGLAASAAGPFLTMLLLLSAGTGPLLGWGSLWQWLIVAVGGALATPVWFVAFDWLHATFQHGRSATTSFRPDREIRRGRV